MATPIGQGIQRGSGCLPTSRRGCGGLIGLFLGPVLLATAYQIFMDWMGDAEAKADDAASSDETLATDSDVKDTVDSDS